MTAHYARLSGKTVRDHWEKARKVNAEGQPVCYAALRIPMARGCSGTGHADGDHGPGGFVGGGTVPMSDPGGR